jgi:hypothetical protein
VATLGERKTGNGAQRDITMMLARRSTNIKHTSLRYMYQSKHLALLPTPGAYYGATSEKKKTAVGRIRRNFRYRGQQLTLKMMLNAFKNCATLHQQLP